MLVQSSGLGALKHNTVLAAWPEQWRETASGEAFVALLRVVAVRQLAVIVPKGVETFPTEQVPAESTIDVYWVLHDGGMMILLGYLLQQHKAWRKSRLRIRALATESDHDSLQMERDLQIFLKLLRIEADVAVLDMLDGDIAASTYERTLAMEQRLQMFVQLNMSRKERNRVVDTIVDRAHARSLVNRSLSGQPELDDGEPEAQDSPNTSPGGTEHRRPQARHLRKMDTAIKINRIIRENSPEASMVILNLPGVPKVDEAGQIISYMTFLEVLTEGIDHALLVRTRGRGKKKS